MGKDLLALNVKIFKVQGQALDQFAKKTCKILVVGNPANTNALICSHYAPSIPKENFSAMTRLDQNRAAGQIAEKLGVPISAVKKVPSGAITAPPSSLTRLTPQSMARLLVLT